MPDMTTALAMPVRFGKARVTITPTGIIDAAPLPSAKTTPYSASACQGAAITLIRPMPMPLTKKTAAQHQPRAGAVGEVAGGEHRGRRHDLKQRDGEAELAAFPAEIVDDRLEGQADGKTRSAADEQHEESGGEDERGVRDDRFSRQGTKYHNLIQDDQFANLEYGRNIALICDKNGS